jgi:hypothetical protein
MEPFYCLNLLFLSSTTVVLIPRALAVSILTGIDHAHTFVSVCRRHHSRFSRGHTKAYLDGLIWVLCGLGLCTV